MEGSKAAWASFAPVVFAAASARAQATPPIPEPTYYGETTISRAAPAEPVVSKPAERAPPFGAAGEFLVTGASNLGISFQQYDASQATVLSASFSPGLDYFVLRNVSIGLSLDTDYLDERGYGADGSLVRTRSTALSAGVRVGVNLPLLEHVSFYPRLTVGFESLQTTQDLISGGSISVAGNPLGYPSTTQTGPTLDIFAPVLIHIEPHLFIGWGPFAFHDLASVGGGPNVGGQRTNVGGEFVVGAWWGGPPPPRTQDASLPAEGSPSVTAPPRRFGQAHQFVISGEIDLSANWLTYAGSNSSTTNVALTPAVDHFVTDHLSLGIGATVSSNKATGIDPVTGLVVTSTVGQGAVALRAGLDVPLASALSFYPRAMLSVGRTAYDEESNGFTNTSTDSIVSVGLYAPLLVHFASHAFVGFGPFAWRDLDHTVQYNPLQSAENRGSYFGASLLVGGWVD